MHSAPATPLVPEAYPNSQLRPISRVNLVAFLGPKFDFIQIFLRFTLFLFYELWQKTASEAENVQESTICTVTRADSMGTLAQGLLQN